MAKPAARSVGADAHFAGDREGLLAGARIITEATFAGLDLSDEIEAVLDQNLGEIVTVCQDGAITAFAICHMGAGSEAGPDTCFIKFAAARRGDDANFERLIVACEAAALRRGMATLVAGVNSACHSAYRLVLAQGFATQLTGVAMQRRNLAGYLAGDALVIGDWR